jgi:hypothetical protein
LQVQIYFDTIINRQHAPSARLQRRRVVHVRQCRARSPPIFRASATASGRASQCSYSSSVALTGGLWASRHDGAGSLFPFSSSPPLLLSPFFYFMNNGSTAPGWASWHWQQRVLSAGVMARSSSLPLLLPILLPFSDDRRMDWYWGISPCGGGSEVRPTNGVFIPGRLGFKGGRWPAGGAPRWCGVHPGALARWGRPWGPARARRALHPVPLQRHEEKSR